MFFGLRRDSNGQLSKERISPNFVYDLHRGAQSFFDTKVTATVVTTLTRAVQEDSYLRGKAEAARRDVSSQHRSFPTRSWSRCEAATDNYLAFYRQEIEHVPIPPLNQTETIRNRQKQTNVLLLLSDARRSWRGIPTSCHPSFFLTSAISRCMVL